jgi:hypothetical protein
MNILNGKTTIFDTNAFTTHLAFDIPASIQQIANVTSGPVARF